MNWIAAVFRSTTTKTRSLVCQPSKERLWNCLGRVAVVAGDVFKWVMHAKKNFVPSPFAGRNYERRKRSAPLAGEWKQSREHSPFTSPMGPNSPKAERLLVGRWRSILSRKRPQRIARRLGVSRQTRIDNAEAIEHFKIGFSDRTAWTSPPTNEPMPRKDIAVSDESRRATASFKEKRSRTDAPAASTVPIFRPKAASVKSTASDRQTAAKKKVKTFIYLDRTKGSSTAKPSPHRMKFVLCGDRH